jgi:hypothetical protein
MPKRSSANGLASKVRKAPKIDPTVIRDFDQRLKVLQSDVRTLKAGSTPSEAPDPEPENLVVEFKDRDGHAVLVPKLIRQHKLSDHEHWTRTEKVIRWLYEKNIKLTTNNIKLCGVGAGTFHKVRVKAKKLIARLEMERNLILKAKAAAKKLALLPPPCLIPPTLTEVDKMATYLLSIPAHKCVSMMEIMEHKKPLLYSAVLERITSDIAIIQQLF